jgi:NosR/NirI family nitrous oxide reductase transcriptional regulator
MTYHNEHKCPPLVNKNKRKKREKPAPADANLIPVVEVVEP